MVRSYNFCWTLNNYTDADLEWLTELDGWRYLIWGKEIAPSTGTPHLQGYVSWNTNIDLSACYKRLRRCHVSIANGSAEENRVYCSKGGDFVELGKMPLSQKRKGDANKERWDLALTAFKERRFADVPTDIGVRYSGGLQTWCQKVYPTKLEDATEPMDWYYGPSGSGKSRKARGDHAIYYLKMCNKWWDDYNGEEVVIIEDFDKKHDVLCHHLKIWGDRYPFPAEIKGGKIDIRPKKIIVTSNYHPSDIWSEDGDLQPILRRFKVTHFSGIAVPTIRHRTGSFSGCFSVDDVPRDKI